MCVRGFSGKHECFLLLAKNYCQKRTTILAQLWMHITLQGKMERMKHLEKAEKDWKEPALSDVSLCSTVQQSSTSTTACPSAVRHADV